MRMLMRLAVVACGIGFAASTAPADDNKPLTDADFVAKAWTGGILEVEIAKLAVANGSDPELKKFAERLMADHSKANAELGTAAKSANIPLPDKLTPDQQKELERFRGLKGADFDRAYASHLVKDHEACEKLCTRASKDLKDPGLKAVAAKNLPIIQEHLKIARQINERINKQ